MKKNFRKLALSRETLRHLESVRGAIAGGTYICTKTYNYSNCGVCCSTADESYGTCSMTTQDICTVMSGTCETGGACTT